MIPPAPITTARLRLRPLQDGDRAAFAAMNRMPEIARWLGPPPTDEDAAFDRLARADALVPWAATDREGGGFLGLVGLHKVPDRLPPAPATELIWRLARPAWGRGLAAEAARAWLEIGFGPLRLQRIVAFTAESNLRSRAVMARIGMTRDPGADFDHPDLSENHPLRPHVVYCMQRHSLAMVPAPGRASG